jgi:lipopolysaccharide cholinephosphotransferase
MKAIGFREAQLLELDILLDFARYCEKHNLTYFIAYGTLLGAVRHGGFIPWDDDIDVWMPRQDYNKLIDSFNENKETAHYRLISPLDPISRHSFVKIIDTRTVKTETNFDYAPGALGLDIDVFPLDGQPDDEETFWKWFAQLEKCYQKADFPVRLTHECRRKRWILALMNLLGGKRHRLGTWIKNYYLKKALRLHAKYPYHGSKYVGAVEHCFGCHRHRYEATLFEGSTLVRFEGHMLKAPKDYDAVLRQAYGDYMTPPPEAERYGHFIDHAYWK